MHAVDSQFYSVCMQYTYKACTTVTLILTLTLQGVHRVRVGNSGALALATLAPLSQDDLVRVRVKVGYELGLGLGLARPRSPNARCSSLRHN